MKITTLAMLGSLLAVIAGSTFASAASARRSENGAGRANLFVSVGCASCHGLQGQGAITGPRLSGKMYSAEAFSGFLRHPVAEMPPYSAQVLSDEQVEQIRTFVNTL